MNQKGDFYETPFQILAIPYRYINDTPFYCVQHRSDCDQWQFIAGGGEDKETPEEAAKREILEEGGVSIVNIISLNRCVIFLWISSLKGFFIIGLMIYMQFLNIRLDLNVRNKLFCLTNISTVFG